MIRSIKLIGTEAGVNLSLDGDVATIFTREKAIDALSFYKALDYHAGDTYVMEEGSCGEIPKGSFDSLEGLVREIIEGINSLSTEDASVESSQNALSHDDAVVDEGIPF